MLTWDFKTTEHLKNLASIFAFRNSHQNNKKHVTVFESTWFYKWHLKNMVKTEVYLSTGNSYTQKSQSKLIRIIYKKMKRMKESLLILISHSYNMPPKYIQIRLPDNYSGNKASATLED